MRGREERGARQREVDKGRRRLAQLLEKKGKGHKGTGTLLVF